MTRKIRLILTATVTVLCLYSCTKDSAGSSEPDRPVLKTSLNVQIPDTKVMLGSGSDGIYKMLWEEGDSIRVNGKASMPLTSEEAGKSVAVFGIGKHYEKEFDIIYPADMMNGGKIVLPVQETYVADGIDPNVAILSGHCTGTSATLSHVCTYIKVTITRKASEVLNSIKLSSSDGTPLSGEFSIDFTAAGLSATDNTSDYVFVSSDGIAYKNNKASVVFAIPAGQYPAGLEISATSKDGARMSTHKYQSVTKLSAGTLTELPAAEFNTEGFLFSGGSGTTADPYRISTAEDINSLSFLCRDNAYSSLGSASYIQTADIDISRLPGFVPICNTPSKPFKGSYDASNHSIYGLASPGLFGFGSGCTISNLTVSADIESNEDNTAGLIRNLVSGKCCNICVEGKISGTSNVGGIAGFISAESDVTVSDCRCYADIEGRGSYVGGIAGVIKPSAKVLINRCAAYGNIKGQCGAGGITGLSSLAESSEARSEIAHTNCLYCGLELELTGNDKSKGLGMLGGIVGWMQNSQDTDNSQYILNCASYVYKMSYVSRCGNYSTTDPCVGGILGCQDGNAGKSLIAGCYSSFQVNRLWCDGETKARTINNNFPEGLNYGGIYGRCSNTLPISYCFYDNTTKIGPAAKELTAAEGCAYSGPYSVLVKNLNTFVDGYSGVHPLGSWSRDPRGCAVPAGTTTEGCRKVLRIGIIGDSISTYRSWIPIGYDVYYYDNKLVSDNTSPCDVKWNSTYWGYLASEYIRNGVIEKNIAWSGSCVATCDNQNTKPGFTTRLEQSGIGAPDIVFIHGGTNDFNHNYNGTATIDNAEGYKYNETVPSTVMETLYSKDISELNTAYYADANLTLVKRIHTEHPNAKIVFIMGDRVCTQMVDVVRQIAVKYKDYCRIVDLHSVSVQKFSGSHPTAKGHKTIADEVYSKWGTWIEE